MARTLSICEQGYRATVEEQDDTIIWITHMLRKSEVDTGLLLRGTAVNYASKSQEPVSVSIGDWTQRHPANLARDLEKFIADGGKPSTRAAKTWPSTRSTPRPWLTA